MFAGDGDDTLSGISASAGVMINGGAGADSIIDSPFADILYGDGADDTIDGGSGNDCLAGGAGGNTITQNDSTSVHNVLFVGTGIWVDQIWLDRVADDLRISIIGTSDQTTVRDWYTGSEHRLDGFFVAEGSRQMDASRVDQLVSAMAAFSPPPAGQFALSQQVQATLDPVLAAVWQ